MEHYYSTEYTEKCDACGIDITIKTQPDKRPDTYTIVYVPCGCGKGHARFQIPVN